MYFFCYFLPNFQDQSKNSEAHLSRSKRKIVNNFRAANHIRGYSLIPSQSELTGYYRQIKGFSFNCTVTL